MLVDSWCQVVQGIPVATEVSDKVSKFFLSVYFSRFLHVFTSV